MLLSEQYRTLREIAELWFRDNWKEHYHSVRRWFKKGPYFEAGNGKNSYRLYDESTVKKVHGRRFKTPRKVA